ncbi:MAG: ABC transporter ATP-binding protein [Deltaproteobacteria bacterium]|nr:ABC transporter ATP-binding protein [Deltaproteobacteria bacterium]
MYYNTGIFNEEKPGKQFDLKLLSMLIPFAGKYRHLLFFAVILVVIITFCDLSLPYVTKIAIDRYIVHRIDPVLLEASFRGDDLKGVAWMSLIIVGISCVGFVFNFIQLMIMEYTGQMIMHDLRLKIFHHIQNLSLSFFTKNPVGRLVTRTTNDVQNMHEMFTSVITFVFKDLFLLAGIAIVLLTINARLALICFTALPVVMFTAFKFAHYARDAFRILRIKIAEINSKLSETIEGVRVIQLFRQEEQNRRAFQEVNHEHYLAGMKQIQVFAVFMPVIELLGSIAVAMVIYYGGGRVVSQDITLGGLVAFISYMRMFFRPVRDIAEKFNIMQNAMSSAERIFLILDNREMLATSGPEPLYFKEKISKLEFKNVSFEYNPGEAVLDDISFQVVKGETVAVVGPTGAGKTSLVNLIIRFYDTTSGSVLINDKDVKAFHPPSIRSGIALVPQDPFLFSGTIRENIIHGNNGLSDDKFRQVLEFSNCGYLVNRLKDGADTRITGSGSSFSSGERQLISIARAFAKDPGLILLDEATSYIDSESEQHIQDALARLMADRTSVIIAHRLSTARHADRIIALNKGRIVETGTHEELMKRKGFYYRLNKIQNSV